jgi:hypothetical protein
VWHEVHEILPLANTQVSGNSSTSTCKYFKKLNIAEAGSVVSATSY